MADYRSSPKWPLLRQHCFEKWGLRCLRCGKTPKDGVLIEGDHVKSVMKYPELSLELSNLQPLCGPCNKWKGTRTIDFRPTLMGKIKKFIKIAIAVPVILLAIDNPRVFDHIKNWTKPVVAEAYGFYYELDATVMP